MLQPLKLLPLLVALAQGSGPICPFYVDDVCCITVDAEALERRILGGRGALAGEFVSAAYGTTSGAWDSGVRAAECVVGLGGCAESDSAVGVPPTDRLLVVLALAVAMLA